MSRPLVIFDLDGTLIETAPDLAAAMNHLLRRLGRAELEPASVRLMVGRGARVLMEKALAATGGGVSEAELDGLVRDYIDVYDTNIAQFSHPFEGLVAALDRLDARGVVSAVCTNKPERLSESLLAALSLRGRFAALVGGDTLPVRKPDPRPLIETIARAGGTAASSVMVGDSITDIETARAAGIAVVGVTFGYTETPMAELGADVTIDHFDELDGAIAELAGRGALTGFAPGG